jgi:hypothetical protein
MKEMKIMRNGEDPNSFVARSTNLVLMEEISSLSKIYSGLIFKEKC